MLSLSKALNELRQGPRTGGFEMDRQTIWRLSKIIANRLQEKDKKRKFIVHIDDPITKKTVSTKIVLKKVRKDNIEAHWHVDQNLINLFILGKRFTKLPTSKLTNFIFSTLSHELTHKFDPSLEKALENPIYKNIDKVKYEDYFNQQTEIRAYLQQVINDIQRRIPLLKSKEDFVQKIDSIKQNPLLILDLSPSWKTIKDSISEKNIKRFYMAAFRLSQLL